MHGRHWILTKRALRSDAIWTHTPFSSELTWRIPLSLDTRTLMRTQFASREELDSIRDERLASLLSFAPRIPFWRDRFLSHSVPESGSSTRLARLPPLSRKEYSGLDVPYFTDQQRYFSSAMDYTSGTTGTPFQFYFDRGATLRSYALSERHFRIIGNGIRYPVVSLRGRPKIGFALTNSYHFYARGSYGVRARLPAFRAFMATQERCILYSFPSFLMELARAAYEESLSFPIMGIISSGEHMRLDERRFVEKSLGARVSNSYSTRELGALGFECDKNRIHLNEEWAYVEILDDDGRPVPDGTEGRIIATAFDNRVMPFIRYETGDRGTISPECCPCGRTLKTIDLKGRTTDRILLKDGRSVTMLELSTIFDAHWDAVHGYQIVQRSPVSFVVRVIPGPKFRLKSMALRFQLMHALHSQASVEWEEVTMIEPTPTGKAVYFVNESRSV